MYDRSLESGLKIYKCLFCRHLVLLFVDPSLIQGQKTDSP